MEIEFGVTVENVSETVNEATVKLADGQTLQADLVLLADGIASRLRPKALVNGQNTSLEPQVGSTTAYQVVVPKDQLVANEATRTLVDDSGLNVWWLKDEERLGYVVGRYNSKLMRYNAIFAALQSGESNSSSLWEAVSRSSQAEEDVAHL